MPGQREVGAKSNEITAVPQLLELLDLQGVVVTLDAMQCQRETAQAIVAREAVNMIIAMQIDTAIVEQSIATPVHVSPAWR